MAKASIHPTALVSPEARIEEDVSIGPQCIIQGDVALGAGTRLMGHVYLQGPMTVGAGNVFYPFTCIGFPPQHRQVAPTDPSAGVRIGDHNIFRESVTIHRSMPRTSAGTEPGDQAKQGAPTTIGDDNYFMVNSHVGHDSIIGNACTLANGVLLAGHVTVCDDVVIGGNTGVHQHCRVGRLAMLSGGTGFGQDVPPFCMCFAFRTVGSLNVVGLRRAGLRDHVKPLKRAFDLLYKGGHGNPEAANLIDLELGDDPLCREFAHFIRTAKRGITPYAAHRNTGE